MIQILQKILPFLFIALFALPLPILMLAVPLQNTYKNFMRRRHYKKVNTFLERPFELNEKQLQEIFPGLVGRSFSDTDFMPEEENG